MEFYGYGSYSYDQSTLFQFPTGWNSTLTTSKRPQTDDVSIPNGMEFYLNLVLSLLFAAGFNSQRDGILHNHRHIYDWQGQFQFPTGWNSTLAHLPNRSIRIVSIPNGMEFYTARIRIGPNIASVSIPNGMEFYRFQSRIGAILPRFNSQRDGILQSEAA